MGTQMRESAFRPAPEFRITLLLICERLGADDPFSGLFVWQIVCAHLRLERAACAVIQIVGIRLALPLTRRDRAVIDMQGDDVLRALCYVSLDEFNARTVPKGGGQRLWPLICAVLYLIHDCPHFGSEFFRRSENAVITDLWRVDF